MNAMAWALWSGWWQAALRGDVCTRCLQPGHVAASCKSPLWSRRA
jgi:hypothetical protein